MSQEMHYELHLVLVPSDLNSFELVGLPLPRDTEFCAACRNPVAETDEGWKPYALVLHSTDHHSVCMSCAELVLRG